MLRPHIMTGRRTSRAVGRAASLMSSSVDESSRRLLLQRLESAGKRGTPQRPCHGDGGVDTHSGFPSGALDGTPANASQAGNLTNTKSRALENPKMAVTLPNGKGLQRVKPHPSQQALR